MLFSRVLCHNIAILWDCTFGIFFGIILSEGRMAHYIGKEAAALYTEQDYADIRAQIKGRALALGIPAALLLAGVIVSFVFRIRYLTIGLSLVLGAFCIFGYGLLLSPVIAYGRHLDSVLHGRVRSTTGAFKEMEEQPVTRDGVRYYAMMLSVGDMENPEDDRLFYYDANLPRPDWKMGEMLTVTAHDKALGAWVRA